jgi:hypothetical protein
VWTRPIDTDGYVTDGPFLKKLKNGKLIMLWSSFGENGYALGCAVSDSGKIFGAWRQCDVPLMPDDGGHGMIFSAFGKDFLCLHTPNEPHACERLRSYEIEETSDGIKIVR